MFFADERETLNLARDKAREVFEQTGQKPEILSDKNLSTFTGELGAAFRLILEEKEILFFAMLQWLVIAVAYLLWTQMLDWIPDEVWRQVSKKDNKISFTLLNLALTGWTFLVVMVASYPLSLLNAAITAVHYLRSAGRRSTIAACLGYAYRNLPRLWVFTTIDAWITVNAILDRMPRKNSRRTAADEALYYAWKVGTLGVVPALTAGKGFLDAAKDSAAVLVAHPLRAIGIRMGYSMICWLIGILGYVGGLSYVMQFSQSTGSTNGVYNFYVLLAVPIVIAVGATAVLVRPLYLVVVARLYSEVIPISAEADIPAGSRKADIAGVIFAVLFCALLAFYWFGDQLGLRGLIESLAERDMRGTSGGSR